MKLRTAVTIALLNLVLAGCASHLAAVPDQRRVLRDKAGLYEVRVPENLPKGWEWRTPPWVVDTDLEVFKREAGYPDYKVAAGLYILTPGLIRADLRAADLSVVARRFMEGALTHMRGRRLRVTRIGGDEVTADTDVRALVQREGFLIENQVGRHRVVETVPVVVYNAERGSGAWRPRGAEQVALNAFLRAGDKLVSVHALADPDQLEQTQRIFYEIIESIRFLQAEAAVN
jgi:hypothetical protein